MYQNISNQGSTFNLSQNLWVKIGNPSEIKDIVSYFKVITGHNYRNKDKILLVDCSKIFLKPNQSLLLEQILYWVLQEAEKKLPKNEYDKFNTIYDKLKLKYHFQFEHENLFYHFFDGFKTLNIKVFLLFRDFDSFSQHIEQTDFKKLYDLSFEGSTNHFWLISLLSKEQMSTKGEYDKSFYSTFTSCNTQQLYTTIEFEYFYDILQSECLKVTIYEHESVNHSQIKQLISSKIGYTPIALDGFKFELLNLIQESHGIHYEEAINQILNCNNSEMEKQEIFISYAWGDSQEEDESREDIVDLIDKTFTEKGFILIRDKKYLGYRGNIAEFEKRIGNGDYIILVITDKFLKSKHCMNEILQIKNIGNVYERIFPIVLKDALIYNEEERIDYLNYWDNEISKLQRKIKKIKNFVAIEETIKTITLYSDIRRIFDEITDILKNMNTLTPEIHQESNFSSLIEAIETTNKTICNKEQLNNYPSASVKTINQHGQKSIYIEKNEGDITIN